MVCNSLVQFNHFSGNVGAVLLQEKGIEIELEHILPGNRIILTHYNALSLPSKLPS